MRAGHAGAILAGPGARLGALCLAQGAARGGRYGSRLDGAGAAVRLPHALPQTEAAWDLLAHALRLPHRTRLIDLLAAHRTHVARQFDAVLGPPVADSTHDPLTELWQNPDAVADHIALLTQLGFAAPE